MATEISRKKLKNINVLTIDGGGIRGVIPATILTHIEKELQRITDSDIKLAEHFDLIVGTSTGSILAGIYSIPLSHDSNSNFAKYSADVALDMYMSKGGNIFKRTFWRKIKTAFSLFGTKYDGVMMMNYFNEYYKNITMKRLITNVMLTSIDMNNRNLFLFKSYSKNTQNFMVKDAVKSSSAAPTYLPPHKLEYNGFELNLTDGGMAMNNPTISAYVEARKLYPNAKNINIMSIGTGKCEKSFKYKYVKKWGKVKWIKPLIDIILTSTSEAVEYQASLLYQTDCTGSYIRINPILKYATNKMDDASDENLNNLNKDGEDAFKHKKEEIEKFLKKTINK